MKVHTKRMESHDPSSKSKATIKLPTKHHDLAVGQVGFIRQEKSKHSVRPAYFITEVIPDKSLIKAKKMLHAHSEIPTKFQNINYEIKMSDFVPAKSLHMKLLIRILALLLKLKQSPNLYLEL